MRIEVGSSKGFINTAEDVGPVSPVTPSMPPISDPMVSTLIRNSARKFSYSDEAIQQQQQGTSSQSSSSSSSNHHLHHGPVKMPVKITNITTSHQLVDKLHHKSKVRKLFRKLSINRVIL